VQKTKNYFLFLLGGVKFEPLLGLEFAFIFGFLQKSISCKDGTLNDIHVILSLFVIDKSPRLIISIPINTLHPPLKAETGIK
jgi:hypothetical protein